MFFSAIDNECNRSGLGFWLSLVLCLLTAVVVTSFIGVLHLILSGAILSIGPLFALFLAVMCNVGCLMLLSFHIITRWWFSLFMAAIYFCISLTTLALH